MKKLNPSVIKYNLHFLIVLNLIFIQSACVPFIKITKNGNNPALLQPPVEEQKQYAEEFDLNRAADVERLKIHRLLQAKDFDAIDKIANQSRSKKERLTGGYWRLDCIYDVLSGIYTEFPKQQISDEMWRNRIEALKKWKEKSPDSITARVALAGAYLNYGWFARGSGYNNSVSNDNRQLLSERVELANSELMEARQLNTKCPGWYRQMLNLGMAEGMPLEQFNQLYDEATKFEPNYLQFYLITSENMLPKWTGKQGDWQKFINELPGHLEGLETDEADIIYFVVLANKVGKPGMSFNLSDISKERVRKGFADLEKKYGIDNFRLNQYAMVTSLILDFPAADAAFKRIGDDRNESVWNDQSFRIARQNVTTAVNKQMATN